MLRQQYDFGKKDSVVTDSSVIRFFLPRLRVEHTIQSDGYAFRFLDVQSSGSADFYKNNYGYLNVPDTVDLNSGWKVLSNDFSLIQYPDAKNLLQFFKVGASLTHYQSTPDSIRDDFVNIIAHGSYRDWETGFLS